MRTAVQEEAQLHAEAVDVLTRAAEYAQPHHDTFDYAGFVAKALSDTASTLGGPQHLLAGRTESWEAHHVAALAWTYSPDTIAVRGPTPVVVPVNVAELIENGDHPGLLGLDAAIDQIGDRYADASSTVQLDAWDDEIVATEERYQREYRSFLRRFGEAAEAASQELGLVSGVYVAGDAHPCSDWWTDGAIVNPRDGVDSDVVCALWNFAHDSTQLPNVDLAYDPPSDQQHLSRGA